MVSNPGPTKPDLTESDGGLGPCAFRDQPAWLGNRLSRTGGAQWQIWAEFDSSIARIFDPLESPLERNNRKFVNMTRSFQP